MYQGTGEPKKISKFKVKYTSNWSINVQVQSRYKSDVKSFTVEIKFKCDDLDHQVSITNSDHYQLLVELYSIKAQSTLK